MRPSAKAAFRFAALASASRAITDAAHESPVFTRQDVVARLGNADRLTCRAVNVIMQRVVRSGAVLAQGERWAVVDEETLCDVVYSQAA